MFIYECVCVCVCVCLKSEGVWLLPWANHIIQNKDKGLHTLDLSDTA